MQGARSSLRLSAADVLALETVVALKISSPNFVEIGRSFPQIWLPLARELSRRLYQLILSHLRTSTLSSSLFHLRKGLRSHDRSKQPWSEMSSALYGIRVSFSPEDTQ